MIRPLAILLCLAALSLHAGAAELSGKINGHDWKAVAAVKSPVQFDDQAVTYHICAEAIDPSKQAGEKPQLLLKVPKAPKVGDALMGKGKTITLFTPPGTNEAFDDGTATVTAVTATSVTIAFDAKSDEKNWVKGEFTIQVGK